ncbi:MAG: dihydroorotate dehydrogenase electron transfer subunit [Oscillospiraceae bacterium]|nr:dihydroorotate dehydrogenase electron transfer subunit [Oscillospiraceae bacterium]
MPNVYECKILENKKLTDSVHSIIVNSESLVSETKPGQFLHIKCGDKHLLRRPISICSVSGEAVRIVFEVKGEGTKWLSTQQANVSLDILGSLGNGFTFQTNKNRANTIIVVGGGIGTPPMLYVAEHAKSEEKAAVTAILGFRSAGDVILKAEFEKICDEVHIMTDDGSAGELGQVTSPLERLLKKGGYDVVMSCGPHKMQEAVAKISAKFGVPCQVSMEERMGCGVGACLVCACATTIDGTEKMTRVCIDGPVYDARKIYG